MFAEDTAIFSEITVEVSTGEDRNKNTQSKTQHLCE